MKIHHVVDGTTPSLLEVTNHFGLGNFYADITWSLSDEKTEFAIDYIIYAEILYYHRYTVLGVYKHEQKHQAFLADRDQFYPVLNIKRDELPIVAGFKKLNPFDYPFKPKIVTLPQIVSLNVSIPAMRVCTMTFEYNEENIGVDNFFDSVLSTVELLVHQYDKPALKYIVSKVEDGSLID